MFKYYTGNMAIIIDQYGPIFMIYHNMCDGCMDRRMDVHIDRRMSGRTDEITCVTLYYPHSSDMKKRIVFQLCAPWFTDHLQEPIVSRWRINIATFHMSVT
jgi:hypothetical protein